MAANLKPHYESISSPNTAHAKISNRVSLHGTFVTLRPLSPDDTEKLWSTIGGPENDSLWTWLKIGPFTNIDDFRTNQQRYLREEAAGKRAIYVILDNKSPSRSTLGIVGLDAVNLQDAKCEVGPMIFGPLLQRSRAGTEANYLIMRHAFEGFGFQRYEWTCNALNTASKRAAERYGFVYEGCLRQNTVVKGKRKDTLYYSMLAPEWPRFKMCFEAWLSDENFDEDGRQKSSFGEVLDAIDPR